jgi:hypothetical protein
MDAARSFAMPLRRPPRRREADIGAIESANTARLLNFAELPKRPQKTEDHRRR